MNVLFEKHNIGHSENYCEVAVQSEEQLKNTIQAIKITNREGNYLLGNIR